MKDAYTNRKHRPDAGDAGSPGAARRRCAAYSPPAAETCALCSRRSLIRSVYGKVRFGQSFAGGAMLAPPSQTCRYVRLAFPRAGRKASCASSGGRNRLSRKIFPATPSRRSREGFAGKVRISVMVDNRKPDLAETRPRRGIR